MQTDPNMTTSLPESAFEHPLGGQSSKGNAKAKGKQKYHVPRNCFSVSGMCLLYVYVQKQAEQQEKKKKKT